MSGGGGEKQGWHGEFCFCSDGRLLSEPFMKLPPRKDYPDYYEIIKKPIDITKIVNRIEDGKVRTVDYFVDKIKEQV